LGHTSPLAHEWLSSHLSFNVLRSQNHPVHVTITLFSLAVHSFSKPFTTEVLPQQHQGFGKECTANIPSNHAPIKLN
jgi:hypothetical protein